MHDDIVIDGLFADRLRAARDVGASDWHWSRAQGEWWRLGGVMKRVESELTIADIAVAMTRAMPVSTIAQFETKECAFAVRDAGRYRMQWFHSQDGDSLSVRIIAESPRSPSVLGIPSAVVDWIGESHGLILIAGATGAGKSTTMSSLTMERAAMGPSNIITLEDPIELPLTHERSRIVQRELGRDFNDYTQAVREALRQDPDVLIIGEIRDAQTLRWALLAAQTGHLVITTVHAQDAAQVIQRTVGFMPAAEQTTMRGILAEVLIGIAVQQMQGVGLGRRPAFEVLTATHAVRALIREDKVAQIPNAIATGAAVGMVSMEDSVRRMQLATVRAGSL